MEKAGLPAPGKRSSKTIKLEGKNLNKNVS
jgi:hypothetical protein